MHMGATAEGGCNAGSIEVFSDGNWEGGWLRRPPRSIEMVQGGGQQHNGGQKSHHTTGISLKSFLTIGVLLGLWQIFLATASADGSKVLSQRLACNAGYRLVIAKWPNLALVGQKELKSHRCGLLLFLAGLFPYQILATVKFSGSRVCAGLVVGIRAFV